MKEDHVVEFPPDQFIQVSIIEGAGFPGQFTDGDGTKAKVNAHAGGAIDGRNITRFIIILNELFIGVRRRERFTSGLKLHGSRRGNFPWLLLKEAVHIFFRRMGVEMMILHNGSPSFGIGSENGVRFTIIF
jgi:hypothetical protein